MPLPDSRNALSEFCLRKLGKGVIDIEISPEQIEDRIDETLRTFKEYHFDGSQTYYYKHVVTGTTITLSAPLSGTFSKGEKITTPGGFQANFYDAASNGLSIRVKNAVGSLTTGVVLTGTSSGATGVAAANALVIGDWDNKYLTLPSTVLSVQKIMPVSTNLLSNLFSTRYQAAVDYIRTFISGDMISYVMAQRHAEMIGELLGGKNIPFRFNKKQNRLYVDTSWDKFDIGQLMLVEMDEALDEEEWVEVYGDELVIRHLTASLKKQWAENLSKYKEIQLPGGVTLNGGEMMTQALDELQRIDEDIKKKYQIPVTFIVG